MCIPNKTEVNEWKASAKPLSCECKCSFDGKKYNSNQMWKTDKGRYECKNYRFKKCIFGNLVPVLVKMVNI